MVSQEIKESAIASSRISFSPDHFLDEERFISISTGSSRDEVTAKCSSIVVGNEFEFLSSKNSFDGTYTMLTADELFFEGKLLPYCQVNCAAQKLTKMGLKSDRNYEKVMNDVSNDSESRKDEVKVLLGREEQEPRIWFVDDDPSPRPPKCNVLWKELLRLKKQRTSTLSPASSSSSSSSWSSSSLGDAGVMEEKDKISSKEKHIRMLKKGLERTRSGSIRIRPMVNVPIVQNGKSTSLPPLFPLRKPKIDR